MRTFIFLIGTTDSLESIEHLENAYNNGSVKEYNMSVFKFQVPDNSTDSMTVRDIATYIGRGLAFSNDWGMDGTLSTLIEVE